MTAVLSAPCMSAAPRRVSSARQPSQRHRLVVPGASATAVIAKATSSSNVVDYRIATMAEQALRAYDQPANLNQATPLQTDKSKGIFFFQDSKVANCVLDVMSGVLQVSILRGNGLVSKPCAHTAEEQSARYIEISNGFSIASTFPVAGDNSVTWEEDHQLLASFETPETATTKDFTVRLVHEAFLQPDTDEDSLRERLRDNLKNFFNRGIDDVLGAATVSLSADDIAGLRSGAAITKDVPLVAMDGSNAGTVALELSYSAFSSSPEGPTRDEWRVAPPLTKKYGDKEAASQAAWGEMMPVALKLGGVKEVKLERVAFLEHVESDTQVWISRCVESKQVVVAFRGSTSLADFKIDSDLAWTEVTLPGCKPVRIHSGFLASWSAVDTEVATLVAACIPKNDGANWRVTTVGHSLGGALASVAAYHLAASDAPYEVSMVSVASPRTGNQEFARAWLNDPANPVRIVDGVRIANTGDIVPKYPFLRPSWLPAFGFIAKLTTPAQEKGRVDHYNHTMCKALVLDREKDGSVKVDYFDQQEEKATLLDNSIKTLFLVARQGLVVMDEHVNNYSLLLRDALSAQAGKA